MLCQKLASISPSIACRDGDLGLFLKPASNWLNQERNALLLWTGKSKGRTCSAQLDLRASMELVFLSLSVCKLCFLVNWLKFKAGSLNVLAPDRSPTISNPQIPHSRKLKLEATYTSAL